MVTSFLVPLEKSSHDITDSDQRLEVEQATCILAARLSSSRSVVMKPFVYSSLVMSLCSLLQGSGGGGEHCSQRQCYGGTKLGALPLFFSYLDGLLCAEMVSVVSMCPD